MPMEFARKHLVEKTYWTHLQVRQLYLVAARLVRDALS
jgi:hypothetical protein